VGDQPPAVVSVAWLLALGAGGCEVVLIDTFWSGRAGRSDRPS
jgi:hypothetical protein